jgi:hypothetical protein
LKESSAKNFNEGSFLEIITLTVTKRLQQHSELYLSPSSFKVLLLLFFQEKKKNLFIPKEIERNVRHQIHQGKAG